MLSRRNSISDPCIPYLSLYRMRTHFECAGFFSKLLEPGHGRRNMFKVLFHLLTKAYIKTANIRETGNSEIKMENMEFVARKDFTEKRSLYAQERTLVRFSKGKGSTMGKNTPCPLHWHQKAP